MASYQLTACTFDHLEAWIYERLFNVKLNSLVVEIAEKLATTISGHLSFMSNFCDKVLYHRAVSLLW